MKDALTCSLHVTNFDSAKPLVQYQFVLDPGYIIKSTFHNATVSNYCIVATGAREQTAFSRERFRGWHLG